MAKTLAKIDHPKRAQGAIPVAFDSKPTTEGPENTHPPAHDPDLPGREELDFEAVGPIKFKRTEGSEGYQSGWPTTPGID